MIRDLLLHGWKSQVRAPFWQRSLAINILLGLLVAYLMLNLLVLGFFLGRILEEVLPGTDPFTFVTGGLLYIFIADLFFRFFMQSFPVMDIQPYLLLPIPKGKLFHYLLLKSVTNVFNLFSLLFFVPFAAREVFPVRGAAAGWAWIGGIVVFTLISHYTAFYLKRQFNVRTGRAVLLLAVAALVGAADWQGLFNLSEYFQQGMEALLRSPYLLTLPLLLLAGIYVLQYRAMYHYTYLDTLAGKAEVVATNTRSLAFLNRLGGAGTYIQLELQQIWRNKRPRLQMTLSLVFLLYPFFSLEYIEGGTMWFALFFWILSIGFPMANYGQFLFSWESPHFDFFMARNVAFREFIEAKYYLLAGSNLLVAIPCLLYGLIDPIFLVVAPVAALFNAGVNVYIVLFFSTYNSRRIDPNKQSYMNWDGVGASQFLMIIPFLVLPLLLFGLFEYLGGQSVGFLSLAVAGILGLASKKVVLPLIIRQFEARKYALVSNFKKQ